MSYLGSWKIDDLLTFPAITHRFDTGALTDADAVPAYRVYEDETGTAILTGNTAKLDDSNTTGFYSEQLTLSAANGFEKGKCYTIYITAAVNSVTGGSFHTFQIEAEVDANTVSATNISANVTQLSGDTTAADNAEAFFDGTGYAGTNNVIPTVTTLTGHTPQTGDAFARLGAPAGASVSADVAAVKVDTAAILVDTGTTLDGKIDTIDGIVDSILVDTAEIGVAGAGLTNINLPNQTMDIVGNITGNLSGSVGSVAAAVAITSNIKQNQALAGFEFMMTDSTGHAPATGKTVTVTRSIDGGAFGAGTLSSVTEVGVGIYAVDFGAGDLNGKVVTLRATATACDDTFERIVTQV